MASNYSRRIAVATLIGELTGSTLRVSTVRSAQAEALLPFPTAYCETAKDAYSRILSLFPAKKEEDVSSPLDFTVVFGCSRGLCGGLDAKLAAGAKSYINNNEGYTVFGERTATLLGRDTSACLPATAQPTAPLSIIPTRIKTICAGI